MSSLPPRGSLYEASTAPPSALTFSASEATLGDGSVTTISDAWSSVGLSFTPRRLRVPGAFAFAAAFALPTAPLLPPPPPVGQGPPTSVQKTIVHRKWKHAPCDDLRFEIRTRVIYALRADRTRRSFRRAHD